ncbi:class I SAM-dependent methyltransferase [archaeon]|nr:class I SAM-dependent methyltransferase [Nanoarchaeota archaeon]MCG2723880.1 class I SAM-dependent methyltransferase [archaeon]
MNELRPGTLLRYWACKDKINELVKNRGNVLDIGCYDGFILSNLEKNKNIVPIVLDLDKAGLKIARKQRLNACVASGIQIPLKKESIDTLLLMDVIEHVKRDDLLINEAYKVLKKGGILFLTTPIKHRKLVSFIVHRYEKSS